MHPSLQSMLISKLNSWNLEATSVKQHSMPVLSPSCPPLSRRRRLHFLYVSCIILLLVPNKLVSNHSTSTPMVKNLPADVEDIRGAGLLPGSGRSLREGHGNPLQYSCLRNPMDRGAWRDTVHGVAKESDMTQQLNTHHLPRDRATLCKLSDLSLPLPPHLLFLKIR